jgi:hypothetical protein
MQSSTHSSQINTVGPAMSFFTSCWLLPQKEQKRVFLLDVDPDLLIFNYISRFKNSAKFFYQYAIFIPLYLARRFLCGQLSYQLYPIQAIVQAS